MPGMRCPECFKWNLDPVIILALALWTGVYVWRFREARREARGRGAGWRQGTAFAACILVLLIALVSPIDSLGEPATLAASLTPQGGPRVRRTSERQHPPGPYAGKCPGSSL